MTVQIEINIRADADLQMVEALISGLAEYLDTHLPIALQEIANVIASEASANAPVKTGLLRSMIHTEVTETGVNIVCNVPYADFQEYGTVQIEPKLFMTNAMEAHYDEISAKIEEVIQSYFRDVIQ